MNTPTGRAPHARSHYGAWKEPLGHLTEMVDEDNPARRKALHVCAMSHRGHLLKSVCSHSGWACLQGLLMVIAPAPMKASCTSSEATGPVPIVRVDQTPGGEGTARLEIGRVSGQHLLL
jgi:hypothetical protein